MSAIILGQNATVEVRCGGKRFLLCEADDGTLYVEVVGNHELEVVVSSWDDDDDQVGVKVRGRWAHVDIAPAEDEDGG